MLIDSHAHLDDKRFEGDIGDVILRARRNGIGKIISIGSNLETSKRAIEIASRYENIFTSVGIHPHEADDIRVEDAEKSLRELAVSEKVVAIGETGLDYYKGFSSNDAQKNLFLFHIQLAEETGKPLIIHCRDAHNDCLGILPEHKLKGVMHCFSGNKEEAKRYIDMGFYISVAGPLTYPNAQKLRETIHTVPLERLIVETDSPYLSPQVFRGKRNEPANLTYIADALADLFEIPLEKIIEITSQNCKNLFGI